MPNPYRKFKIDFSHEQQLQNSRGKLSHALNILTNMKDTVSLIGEHSKAMVHSKSIPESEQREFQRDLDNLSREIQCYIQTSGKLLRMSDDLKSMASPQTARQGSKCFSTAHLSNIVAVQYDNILTFRGQEIQYENSLKLTQLAQADAVENKDMAILADLTYKDSRTMRIATVIAMFYLPANLVMVCPPVPLHTLHGVWNSDFGSPSTPPPFLLQL